MSQRTLGPASLVLWMALLGWLAPLAWAQAPAPTPVKRAVSLHEGAVFFLHRAEGKHSLEERAQRASQALALAAGAATAPEVRVERAGDVATVLAGSTPIVELHAEDAELAGDSSLDV